MPAKLPKWATKCLKRDLNKCRECGSSKSLVVHQKTGWGSDNYKPSNLVTLCKICHAEVHDLLMKLKPQIDIIEELKIQGMSFEKIGKHLGVSRQRVHQVWKNRSI